MRSYTRIPETDTRGKPIVFASIALRHCAVRRPGVLCHCVVVGQPAQVVFPQSTSCDATCEIWESESNTLLLGSITAMSTTIADTSCIPLREPCGFIIGSSERVPFFRR